MRSRAPRRHPGLHEWGTAPPGGRWEAQAALAMCLPAGSAVALLAQELRPAGRGRVECFLTRIRENNQCRWGPPWVVKIQRAPGTSCTVACGVLVSPILLRLQTQLVSTPSGASTTLDKLASGLQGTVQQLC